MLSPCSITSAHRLMPAKAVGALSCFFLYTAFSSPRANSTSGSTGSHQKFLRNKRAVNTHDTAAIVFDFFHLHKAGFASFSVGFKISW